MNTTLRDATAAELRLLLQVIARQGKSWTQEMPPAAAREASRKNWVDLDIWPGMVAKYQDDAVDIMSDLVSLEMMVERLLIRLAPEPDEPPDLTLVRTRKRNTHNE